MDLSINRLKALSKLELNKIDEKIKELKDRNDNIFSKYLEELKKEVIDYYQILKEIEYEYNKNNKEYEEKKQTLTNKNKR